MVGDVWYSDEDGRCEVKEGGEMGGYGDDGGDVRWRWWEM